MQRISRTGGEIRRMIIECKLELMKEGYGTLYEIENRMRKFAKLKMELEYGLNWQVKITKELKYITTPFEQLYFHQLVSFYKKVPPLTSSIPSTLYLRLYKLNTTRNKIAHNHLISKLELNELIDIKNRLDKLLIL